MITFKHTGDFKMTTRFFSRMTGGQYLLNAIKKYGQIGCDALAAATPVDTGLTAESWEFAIEVGQGSVSLIWSNTNENKSLNIVYLLVYGHGTGTGGWVQGRDFITPAIEPVMDQIVEAVWREVKSA